MRWSFILLSLILLTTQLLFAKDISGQNINNTFIKIEAKNEALTSILDQIEKKSPFSFVYRSDILNKYKNFYLKHQDASVSAVLQTILDPIGLQFRQVGKNILIYEEVNRLSQPTDQYSVNGSDSLIILLNNPSIIPYYTQGAEDTLVSIRGRVVDDNNQPMEGVSIAIYRKFPGIDTLVLSTIALTQKNGTFSTKVPKSLQSIVISHIGFVSTTVTLNNKAIYEIALTPDQKSLNEVVVNTGLFTRKKESFSGATSSFTGEQLKLIGNQNVLQSLRTLDPSFLIMENNAAGSNPNVLPTIELRGQTSITTTGLRDQFSQDPNQPLFILDGFETSLQSISDLDMNRVASITLLKDAASTAIYGSRASNGVIVVETIRPIGGTLNESYTADLTAEIPDLSSYNMMNAREKLEFERLSGRYTVGTIRSEEIENQNIYYDPLYSSRLQEVERGVNTYWLKDPVQTGFAHRHSFYVNGGNETLTFNAGGNYRWKTGAMKGSERNEWGTRLNLNYRKGKINISNNLYISGYNSAESPYGDFSTWVNVNPYYRKLSADEKYLEQFYNQVAAKTERIPNPLYNAKLNSFDKSKNYIINDNLQIIYNLSNELKFQSALQVTKGNTQQNVFVSPLNTKFDETEMRKKGTYKYASTDNSGFTANAMLTYGKTIARDHLINANVRTEVQQTTYNLAGYNAEGFPNSSNGNPRFAYGYAEDGQPLASKSVRRRNSILMSANYSYKQRYNFDASVNYDGSTQFGQENLYSPFYSFGMSWNAKNESFLINEDWLTMLRVRGNVGITGNQNFGSSSSLTTYNYDSYTNYFGQGVYLSSLGNPDLEWQNTRQISLGIDGAAFNNRLKVQLNAYQKYTDPLVIAIALPSSTGLSNYPFNAGTLDVKGLEWTASYLPINNMQRQIVWTISLMGSVYTQKYGHFDNLLEGLNANLRESNSLTRYRDGYDPADLWAVRSLGIDPATGREIFLKKDGSQTFDFDYADQVVVGNSRPTVQGVVGNMLSYKGFILNLSFRYSFNQDNFNSAIYSKVENISMNSVIYNNQDKRALYERWKQPGDIAQYKSISLLSTTPMSSRFIQKENYLSLESATIGYQFQNALWMKSAHLSNLRVNAFTNDIFRISNIRRERGTSYPYARSISLSITANFK